MPILNVSKVVSTLPDPLAANTVYAVRVGAGFDLYISDSTGTVAHKINLGTIYTISATAPDPAVYPLWITLTGQIFAWDGEEWFEVGGGGAAGGETPPGGTSGQIQYNSAGSFAGAANVHIESGFLRLLNAEPGAAPSAGGLKLFSRNVAGRSLPAFMGPSGLDSALQAFLARNKIAWFNPPGNATTVQVMGMAAPSATGTATAASVAVTNIHTVMRRLEYAVTTASATAVAGSRSTALQYHIGDVANNLGGFTFVARFGPSRGVASNATRRGFAGLTSNTGAPTDANPSAGTTWANMIGVGHDAADTNWQIMHRTGTGTVVKVDTGIPKAYADNSEMFELALFSAPGATPSVGYKFTRLSDGVSFEGTITSDLPSATQLLTWQIWNSVGGTSSVIGVSVASVYIETDY